jgi:hypothetical protein
MNPRIPGWCFGLTPLLIVIFALTLGPEEFAIRAPTDLMSPSPRPQQEVDDKRSLKPAFPVRAPKQIDREMFVASFRRQSVAELLPCLRTWQSSPASIMVEAVLTKAGRLEHLRMMDRANEMPACLQPAVEQMNFQSIAQQLDRPSVQIQWRVDW